MKKASLNVVQAIEILKKVDPASAAVFEEQLADVLEGAVDQIVEGLGIARSRVVPEIIDGDMRVEIGPRKTGEKLPLALTDHVSVGDWSLVIDPVLDANDS